MEYPFEPKFDGCLSYSAISTYKNCPLAFKYRYIDKIKQDATYTQEHADFGSAVHSAIEKWLKSGNTDEAKKVLIKTTDPRLAIHMFETATTYIPPCDEIIVEQKLAIDKDLNPVDFFSDKAMFRGIVDLAIRKGNHIQIIDWKTGYKEHDYIQLYTQGFMMECAKMAPNTVSAAQLRSDRLVNYEYDAKASIVAKEYITTYADEIKNKIDFKPNVSSKCSWCQFLGQCEFAKKSIDELEPKDWVQQSILLKEQAKKLEDKAKEYVKNAGSIQTNLWTFGIKNEPSIRIKNKIGLVEKLKENGIDPADYVDFDKKTKEEWLQNEDYRDFLGITFRNTYKLEETVNA